MKAVVECPACGGRSFRPFSFTVDAERGRDMHFAQTRCLDCDLVFSNPVAQPDELEHFYETAYYAEHEPDYDLSDPGLVEVRARPRSRRGRRLRQSVLPYKTGGTFFEIGAGFGGMLEGARLLGFTVAGVEPSVDAARFAREVMGFDGLRQGLFVPSDWPEAFCDVIYSYMVIEHVSDLHEFAGGHYRLLKPGGLAVIGTENHHNVWVNVRRVRSWLKGRRLPESRPRAITPTTSRAAACAGSSSGTACASFAVRCIRRHWRSS